MSGVNSIGVPISSIAQSQGVSTPAFSASAEKPQAPKEESHVLRNTAFIGLTALGIGIAWKIMTKGKGGTPDVFAEAKTNISNLMKEKEAAQVKVADAIKEKAKASGEEAKVAQEKVDNAIKDARAAKEKIKTAYGEYGNLQAAQKGEKAATKEATAKPKVKAPEAEAEKEAQATS